MTRRKMMMASAAAFGLLATFASPLMRRPARAAEPLYEDDHILGAADAPITIIEYSSLTCPHCANFHRNTFPDLKENWIDTGKARVVYRHFPFDGLGLRAAAVANCIEGERHFSFLDALFRGQKVWTGASDPMAALAQLGALAGLDRERFDACVADQAEMDKILARAQEAQSKYNVDSTPTFIINGQKVSGAQSYEAFNEILEQVAAET